MTPEEIREIFEEYQRHRALNLPVSKELATRVKDASKGIKDYSYDLEQNLNNLKFATQGLFKSFKDGKEGASVYNDSIRSGAELLAHFLKVLGPLGVMLGFVAQAAAEYAAAANDQSDALFNSYTNLSKMGAGFAEGMDSVYKTSQQLGYSTKELDQYGSLIDKNRKIFALFGGNTSRGVKEFSGLVDSLRGFETEFRSMGLSSSDVNDSVANFLTQQTLLGRSQVNRDGKLTSAAYTYIQEQMMVSRLTGLNAEAQKAADQQMADNNVFQIAQRDLRKKQQAALEAGDKVAAAALEKQFKENVTLIKMLPESMRKGAMDIMTGYASASDEAEQFIRLAPQAAKQIQSGQFSAIAVLDTASKEAKTNLDRFSGSLGKLGQLTDIFGDYKGIRDLELLTSKSSMAERKVQAENELETRKNANDGTRAYAGMLVEQRRTREAAEDAINIGVDTATKVMLKLTTAAYLAAKVVNSPSSVFGPSILDIPPTLTPDIGVDLGDPEAVGIVNYQATTSTRPSARPGSTQSLLNLIGQVEGKGNYNILVGGKTETTLTDMTIQEVLDFQDEMLRKGHESTAIGKYQIIRNTLRLLISNGSVQLTDKFSPSTQDKLAIALLNRRGYQEFINGKITADAMADKIAMEWASFPTANGASYYAGVGSNKALVERGQVISTLKGYRFGGISEGPDSGYMVELHGSEAVVPLPDGRSIPVQMPGYEEGIRMQNDAIMAQNDRLDDLVAIMRTRNQLTEKILRAYIA